MAKKIQWNDNVKPLESKLQHYGKKFYYRFIHHELSTLHLVQKEALIKLVSWFRNEHEIKDTKDKTAVVAMPTGTGKTGVICCLPYALMGKLSPREINTKKPVLILAPGVDILHQLQESLSGSSNAKSFLETRGLLQEEDIEMQAQYSVHVIEKAADVANLENTKCDIVLSNAQKWRKNKSADHPNYEKLSSDLFSMVIVDEAHHLPAKQWADIVRKFKANAKIIFLTATPYRADGREITEDHTLSTKGFAYKLTREMAINQQLIRKLNFIEIENNSKPPEKRTKLSAENYSNTKEDEASERMTYAEEVLTQVKNCMDEKNRDHPLPGGKQHAAIIVTKNIYEANTVRFICIQLGFGPSKVKVVHTAKIKTRAKRRAVTEEIKDGHFQVVIVVQMLLEGFDYPPFSIAGIVTNIQSRRKFAQFVGRIQRLVRHTNENGRLEIETRGIGHVITHEFFKQGELYDTEFVKVPMTEEGNSSIYEVDEEIEEERDTEEDPITNYLIIDEDSNIAPITEENSSTYEVEEEDEEEGHAPMSDYFSTDEDSYIAPITEEESSNTNELENEEGHTEEDPIDYLSTDEELNDSDIVPITKEENSSTYTVEEKKDEEIEEDLEYILIV